MEDFEAYTLYANVNTFARQRPRGFVSTHHTRKAKGNITVDRIYEFVQVIVRGRIFTCCLPGCGEGPECQVVVCGTAD